MNKKYIYILITVLAIAIAGLLLVFARQNKQVDNDKPKVAATIFPLYDIARNVAGDNADVELLLPPGASPHFYEFTPKQLSKLQGTDVIFAIGHGLDGWASIAENAVGGAEVVTVDKGITLREAGEDDHEEEDHEHEEGLDPHYWLNFENARTITDTVAEQFSELDPDNADAYKANADAYKNTLTQEENELKARIQPLASRNLITFHDSWYYFADNFGLNIIGTFEPSAGEEPTPKYLASLQTQVKEQDVHIIFSEPQYSSSALAPFLQDNDLGFAVLDPIGGTGNINSYVELMRYNVNTALNALDQ